MITCVSCGADLDRRSRRAFGKHIHTTQRGSVMTAVAYACLDKACIAEAERLMGRSQPSPQGSRPSEPVAPPPRR